MSTTEFNVAQRFLDERGVSYQLSDGNLEIGSSIELTDTKSCYIKFWCSFYLGYEPYVREALDKLKELGDETYFFLNTVYSRFFN